MSTEPTPTTRTMKGTLDAQGMQNIADAAINVFGTAMETEGVPYATQKAVFDKIAPVFMPMVEVVACIRLHIRLRDKAFESDPNSEMAQAKIALAMEIGEDVLHQLQDIKRDVNAADWLTTVAFKNTEENDDV